MLARNLESTLAGEAAKTDLSQRRPDDMPLRFENLRGYRLLPFGRTKNVTHLSIVQIATAILATATVQPGFAGLAGKILSSLRPVGGAVASFQGCETLGRAIECLLENSTARDALLEVRVSDSEIYTNAYGRASIIYTDGSEEKTAHYIGQNAVTLDQPGVDKTFNPRELISSVITETTFYPRLFRRIADVLELPGYRGEFCLNGIFWMINQCFRRPRRSITVLGPLICPTSRALHQRCRGLQ